MGKDNKQKATVFAELSAIQKKAAILLAAGKSRKAVAEAIGYNPCTIFGWLNQPAFRAAVSALTDQVYEEGKSALLSVQRGAVSTLVKLLSSDDQKVALAAATRLLERVERRKELDIGADLAEIERLLAGLEEA